MVEPQPPNATTTKATLSAWAMDKQGPEYYRGLKDKFELFLKGSELLPVPLIMETVNTRTISLLTTDVKPNTEMNCSQQESNAGGPSTTT